MWPTEVPSDLEIEEMSERELGYRWSFLTDLCGEFQGAAIAWAIIAALFPALVIASISFGWYENYPTIRLVIAGLFAVGGIAVSVYSWIWLFWVRRRLKKVEHKLGL